MARAATSEAGTSSSPGAAAAESGRNNGAPGKRPHYHAYYYGAFVFNPDGNNVEAMFHGAP